MKFFCPGRADQRGRRWPACAASTWPLRRAAAAFQTHLPRAYRTAAPAAAATCPRLAAASARPHREPPAFKFPPLSPSAALCFRLLVLRLRLRRRTAFRFIGSRTARLSSSLSLSLARFICALSATHTDQTHTHTHTHTHTPHTAQPAPNGHNSRQRSTRRGQQGRLAFAHAEDVQRCQAHRRAPRKGTAEHRDGEERRRKREAESVFFLSSPASLARLVSPCLAVARPPDAVHSARPGPLCQPRPVRRLSSRVSLSSPLGGRLEPRPRPSAFVSTAFFAPRVLLAALSPSCPRAACNGCTSAAGLCLSVACSLSRLMLGARLRPRAALGSPRMPATHTTRFVRLRHNMSPPTHPQPATFRSAR